MIILKEKKGSICILLILTDEDIVLTATGYESDNLFCTDGRFNRTMLSLPEIVVLPCTPLPSSVESSPMSSSSSSSSISLVHQSSSEHPTAGTSRFK